MKGIHRRVRYSRCIIKTYDGRGREIETAQHVELGKRKGKIVCVMRDKIWFACLWLLNT